MLSAAKGQADLFLLTRLQMIPVDLFSVIGRDLLC